MPPRVKPLLLALFLASASTMAVAQMSPFGTSGFTMDQSDIESMSSAAQPIYQSPPPANGSQYEWSNPKTGSSGTMTLLESREYQGLPCRKIQYNFKIKNVATDFSFVQERCQVASGEWKTL